VGGAERSSDGGGAGVLLGLIEQNFGSDLYVKKRRESVDMGRRKKTRPSFG